MLEYVYAAVIKTKIFLKQFSKCSLTFEDNINVVPNTMDRSLSNKNLTNQCKIKKSIKLNNTDKHYLVFTYSSALVQPHCFKG